MRRRSRLEFGVDYYLVALQISGVGTVLTGVNFVTTILKIRAPGMSYLRMPIFCWTALASNLLIIAAFPVLTVTLALLMLDRYLGFHFFTNDGGGNSMLYMNLIWVWGHPEVYILVLPAFGIYSEVVSTFSGKPLFGYRSMVFATLAICIISFMVWLHHFFTMGAGADVNAIFGIASMIIGVPTGVKIYNWLFTMYGGRVRFNVPMYYAIGFMLTFVIGGLTGVLLAISTGRFHRPQQPVPGGALPPGYHRRSRVRNHGRLHLLVPEGLRLHARRAARQSCLLVLVHRLPPGLHAPLRARFMGRDAAHAAHPRCELGAVAGCRFRGRCDHWPWDRADRRPAALFNQDRDQRRDITGDPWDGRTLEWLTLSPPPHYNFAVLPDVHGEEAYWTRKQTAIKMDQLIDEPDYQPIEMPVNTPTGVIVALFASLCGFALIWYIWWLAILGLVGAFAVFVWYAWRDEHDHIIPVEEVRANARERRRIRMEHLHKLSQST